MSLIRIPYNDLGNPTPNGTWVNNNQGPDIVNYDDQIDFTGFAFGTYSYTYTVNFLNCVSRTILTYEYVNTDTVINDLCTNAISLELYQSGLRLLNQNNVSSCETKIVTLSVTPIPSEWNNPDGDLWYIFTPPPNVSSALITVSGNSYQEGIQRPQIALYSDCNTFIKSKSSQTQLVQDYIYNPLEQPYLIRVSSNQGAGDFTITINFNSI